MAAVEGSRPRSPAARFGRLLAALALVVGSLAGAAAAPRIRAATEQTLRSEAFQVRAIAVRGARHLPALQIAATAGIAPGTPLVDVDPRQVEERLRRHPWIASAHALRLPPARLLISVTERVPRAVAAAGKAGDLHLVDAAGVAFARAPAAEIDSLPRIHTPRPAMPGRPDPGLARAVALSDTLARLGFAAPAEVRVAAAGDPAGLVLRLRALQAEVCLGRSRPGEALARLARLVAARPDELVRASHVDLRFADRVVLRSRSAPEGAG